MKNCPYCAEEIQDEAVVCRYCGRELVRLKKPWLTALLNVFHLVMGLGYIYLGKWGRFVAVFAIQLFSLMLMTAMGLREYNVYLLGLLWLYSISDGYSRTKGYNQSKLSHPST